MSTLFMSKFYSKAIRHSFSEREDEQIRKLVNEYGDNNWKTISDCIGTRTARQCRERYKNYLMPGLVNGPWTEDEDSLLVEKYTEIGPKWTNISLFFPTRSEINLKNRWSSISKRKRSYNKEDYNPKCGKIGITDDLHVKKQNATKILNNDKIDIGKIDFPPVQIAKKEQLSEEERKEEELISAIERDLFSFGFGADEENFFSLNNFYF